MSLCNLKKRNETEKEYNERLSKMYYSNGYHINEIANKMEIDIIEVYNYITGSNYTTTEEREKMISLYNSGVSYEEIAKKFSKSVTCIKDRIKSPTKLVCGNSDEMLSDKQIKKMKNMAIKGYCAKDIAEEIGISENSVIYRMSHTDLDHKIYRNLSVSEMEKMVKLCKNGKSYKEIAKICKRSDIVVIKVLDLNGL